MLDKKKAYLVCPYVDMDRSDYRSKELELLAKSALYDVVKCDVFYVKELNARTYFGMGKVQSLADEMDALHVDIVIMDCPLTGSQLRNLTELIGVQVIDRTALILDIFASRAKSKEGVLEVQLAKLKYQLPRTMSEKVDGERSGMRGESESKTEIVKRKIREDIAKLEKEIKEIEKHRQTNRKQRLSKMKSVALVGYTNAGKSTLMNAIAKANTYADDRLFATLDVLTKKVWDNGTEYVLIDTVGFVSNLPHELMYAFSATLEETLDADVLLVVVDSSDPHKYEQISVVERELDRLNVDKSKVILVYNKADKIDSDELKDLKKYDYETCIVQAKSGTNVDKLKSLIKNRLDKIQY